MPDRLSYDEAMRLSQVRLKIPDSDLKQGAVEMISVNTARMAIPKPWGIEGGFAVVYKFRTKSSQVKAFRCFRVPMNADTQFRYERMSAYFRTYARDITIEFDYYDQGIKVDETNQGTKTQVVSPVIVMEWVEGITLVDRIDELCRKRNTAGLADLAEQWIHIMMTMQQAHMSHGDLAGVNVMVRNNGRLVLIDYDGVYIPEFATLPQIVLGQKAYQHPDMLHRPFNEYTDAFSGMVIYLSLLALQVQPALWGKYVKRNAQGQLDGNLLFMPEDFEQPDQSALFRELEQMSDKRVQEVARALKQACKQPIATVRFPMSLLDPDYQNKQQLQKLEVAIRQNDDAQIIALWVAPLDSYASAQQHLARVRRAKERVALLTDFRQAYQRDNDDQIVSTYELIEQAPDRNSFSLTAQEMQRVALAQRRKTALVALRVALQTKNIQRIVGAYDQELENSKNITPVEKERVRLAQALYRAYHLDDDDALVAVADTIQRSPFGSGLVLTEQERLRVELARQRVQALTDFRTALASKRVSQIAAASSDELARSKRTTADEREIMQQARAFVQAYQNDDDDEIVTIWQTIQSARYHAQLELTPQEEQRVKLAGQRKQALSQFRLTCYRSRKAHEIVSAYSTLLDDSKSVTKEEREKLDAARRYIAMYDEIVAALGASAAQEDTDRVLAAYDEELVKQFKDFSEEQNNRLEIVARRGKLERALATKAYGLALHTAREIEMRTRSVISDTRLSVARNRFIRQFEPRNLQVRVQGGQVIASWDWPTDELVQYAFLACRADSWPLHPSKDDPGRMLYRVNRGSYKNQGYFQFPIGTQRQIYVQVYFAISEYVDWMTDAYWFYSRGDGPTSRQIATITA